MSNRLTVISSICSLLLVRLSSFNDDEMQSPCSVVPPETPPFSSSDFFSFSLVGMLPCLPSNFRIAETLGFLFYNWVLFFSLLLDLAPPIHQIHDIPVYKITHACNLISNYTSSKTITFHFSLMDSIQAPKVYPIFMDNFLVNCG